MQQLRRQERRARLVAFGWQRQGGIGITQGGGEIQADMAMAELMAGQGRGQEHRRVALGFEFAEKAGEGPVHLAQPAALHPEFQ